MSVVIKRILILMTVVFVAFEAFYWFYLERGIKDTITDNPVLQQTYLEEDQPITIRAFELIDHNKKPFTVDHLKGKWSLLFAGYTNCPDVCPLTLGVVANVFRKLERDSVDIQSLQAVFLTVDPHRDSAEVIKPFLKHFDERFIGVTGDRQETDRLCHNIGCGYELENDYLDGGKENYLVSHPTSLYLVDPAANVVGVFPRPSQSQLIIDVIEPLIDVHQLVISDAWIRQPPPGASTAAAYFTIKNTAQTPAHITDVKIEGLGETSFHHTTVSDGRAKMEKFEKLIIDPGETLKLMPGGTHLMIRPESLLELGQSLDFTFFVSDRRPMVVTAEVRKGF